ncbi:hypothetical protein BPOR_0664g00070 [Botrytis porri]|uniref:Uncharacterized protein n=1 Tax=Botrytis porri TaxID=87229 RepID=A0A4Z1KIC0_9HELO|nr:hypothetical protein BPOR_0664g00070 [Botrytis porri]
MNGNRAPAVNRFRKGSLQEETPLMKKKMARVEELTESLYPPTMISDAKEQLLKLRKEQYGEDSKDL